MTSPMPAAEVLDREFLGIRARLIDIAAALDRMDRASGTLTNDPRLENVRKACGVLAGEALDRAEQLQLIFSLPYDENWQTGN